ncbi:MAG: helix-turn-helix transcriptional regulator [Planctomycetes bacterium]|nr:helix-turn-helix transcriptional regulator [Planctomycetota bacterium]
MRRKNIDIGLPDEITSQNCGEKLDLICGAAGISMKELAELTGVQPATLSHIKSGRRQPTQKFMDRLQALALIRPKGYEREAEGAAFTASAVAAGLSSLARAKLLGSAAIVAVACSGGIGGGLLSFGVLHAVDAICKKLGLACKESKNEVEITKEPDE